jgi:hypothetical protein
MGRWTGVEERGMRRTGSRASVNSKKEQEIYLTGCSHRERSMFNAREPRLYGNSSGRGRERERSKRPHLLHDYEK